MLKELEMADMNSTTASGKPKMLGLKEVFDRYVEETITDKQIQRVLEPALKLLQESV